MNSQSAFVVVCLLVCLMQIYMEEYLLLAFFKHRNFFKWWNWIMDKNGKASSRHSWSLKSLQNDDPELLLKKSYVYDFPISSDFIRPYNQRLKHKIIIVQKVLTRTASHYDLHRVIHDQTITWLTLSVFVGCVFSLLVFMYVVIFPSCVPQLRN